MKSKFLVCVPFSGLGLYNGFRGNRWLKNRIKIFKQFVVPSLLAQTDRDFVLWVAWRAEERINVYVQELNRYLILKGLPHIFTYSGVPFFDDKYPDEEARERLFQTLKGAMPQLLEFISDCEEVHWLLQPSDDIYHVKTVQSVKAAFENPEIQAVGYQKGYIMNYNTLEVKEYNPKTNPPFFAIKFPRNTFIDPGKHMSYTGPYKSHEYIGEKLKMGHFEDRGFIVGTHFDNISTGFDNPYAGETVQDVNPADFGLVGVQPLPLPPWSINKAIFNSLPHQVKRKLRFWSGEKKWVLRPLFAVIYNGLRS